MLFSSITFLYYFLPITLLVYFLVPERGKNVVLLAASFLFYFWGEPKYSLLMAATVLAGYVGGIWIERAEAKRQGKAAGGRGVFFIGIVLGSLILFKYADFLIGSVNAMAGSSLPLLKLALPLGISFYTFQIISYLIDVRRKEIPAERNFINFAAYVMMFPQLIAGPIVRYSSIAEEMKKRRLNWQAVAEGSSRFACGLAKKVLIADVLSELVAALDKAGTAGGLGMAGSWVLAAAYTLQIYYDFSGYSDMAIGLGRILGFTFPENFDHPLVSKSITEFWRRWHMTLGGWFRDYVYIPLGGSRVKFGRWLLNVLVVWFLSGLWHGASWNFALWGLYFGCFLIAEKAVRTLLVKWKGTCEPEKKQKNFHVARLAGHIYTVTAVVISFVIFRQENLTLVWENLREMFGAGGVGVSSPVALYQIKNYGFLLVAAAFGATPCISRLLAGFDRKEGWQKGKVLLQPMVTILLLLVSTAFMIGSSAHPFLYFRF